jgi:hypothetical protein
MVPAATVSASDTTSGATGPNAQTQAAVTKPMKPWVRADLERDQSWVYPLSQAEVTDLEASLRHVLELNKTEFELSAADFPLTPAIDGFIKAIVNGTQTGYGFFLARGFPVERWTPAELRTLFWCVGLRLGVPRPQGKASQYLSDVRDAGGQYRGGTGRGYNTNSKLDFHADGSDIVGLFCLQTAKSGGTSLISNSYHAYNELKRLRPELAQVLCEPFYFGRQGEHAAEEPPYYQASIVGFKDGQFACRHIRNHINGGQLTFTEIPRLTPIQNDAMDMFDQLLARDDFCFHMELEKGDLQFLNNHVNLHARTAYEDHPDPAKKRHLLRLWLSIPEAIALPELWKDAYKDVNTRALRGGFRGVGITPEIREFEKRLCAEHGIAFDIYRDFDSIT